MVYKDLTSKQVQERQQKYGKNVLPEEKTLTPFKIFFSQFANPIIYILVVAGLVSFFLKKYLDIGLIASVVVVNALMGFFQEYKTQKTLVALKKLITPTAKVFRDGAKQVVLASELVPGDTVFLGIGDRISADGKIIEAVTFFVNESILTGESEGIEKKLNDEVYMGTTVLAGRAVMEVKKIGLSTKIGEIATTIRETEEPETTMQLRLKRLTKSLVRLSIVLCSLIFVYGFFAGREMLEMLEISAVLLVAVIPEALLIVITLVLVLAMRDSLKRKALIKKILSVETLGSITTICTDKTGTLTEGNMRVTEVDLKTNKDSSLAMCLCNDMNDTLEIAIWSYLKSLKDFDAQKCYTDFERVFEISFSSEHKFMATVNIVEGEYVLFVKGAPEIVANMSTANESEKENIQNKINLWAEQGLKILGLASKKISKNEIDNISIDNISGLNWEGMIGLWDPPRKEVRETMEIAREAGLDVKVVTGDYGKTAVKIMANIGLNIGDDEVLEGSEMDKLSDKEFYEIVGKIKLFTRVTPKQKLRIVSALQDRGEIVAMTGDGVNDAPALKKANIGIVVGDATEVAKETADLILLDNNFKTIVSAVEAGRLVFENIKKIILFILSNSFAEITVIFGALVFNWPFPITVVQILWLHILCDGPEDFILGFEPREKETMLEGPKKISEPIIGGLSVFLITTISLLSGIISLGFFWYFGIKQGNIMLGQTMAFMSLAFSSITYIFSCRTLRKPFWKYENFWSNKGLFAVVAFSLSLAIIVTYWGPTQKLLGLVPLEPIHWALLITKGILLVTIVELAKFFSRDGKKTVREYREPAYNN